ncbi:carboxymuconolactone decarboxylase family protein [Streptomyces sp. NBC_01591]|uniref:carboxymuconolactone decarboxylase family protein n=1 Tax=Streptomyces sp. NBC_01591 TaxID=2975888 RepID=UPI002DD87E63|nr:carboxymuconolactone decarboxylase family protein [Streptomyces sp. NBC_01591]WSD72348.1 carboxymuconolactone decarboxylase family protein [Streptomyces sp. NBC_01591]
MAARIPLDPPRTLLFRAMSWYSNRTYGKVVDPVRAHAHHTGVLWSLARLELAVGRWKKLDPQLKALAVMTSAATVGCSWCMDFGYLENHRHGMDPRKLRDVPLWRESGVYTPLERDVMEYSEAMSLTPPEVGDEPAERLRTALGEAAFVELTTMVAVENMRSRTNSALALTSQGFKDRCEVDRPANR